MTSPGSSGSTPPRHIPSWTDLGPRVLSAAVLIAIIATGLYFGGYVFAGLAAIVFGITYREWEQMVTLQPLAPFGMVLIALLALAAIVFPFYGPIGTLAVMVVAAIVSVFGGRAAAPWRAFGLLFFGALLIAVLAMRGTDPAGITAGWYLGIVIALNDTGAYFVGRVIGGEKLAPMISPAKTRSGAIGGWVIGMAAGTIYWVLFVHSPWWIGLLFSAVLGLVGQAGDLTESAIKRVFRVKDSGDIIPGHGGFMDRLDSVSFGVLFLFAVGALHGGIGNVAGGFLNW
ncbi:MAG: phosphatidate cytidylyltransferase [Devosia nanyangense]|uniref:Phosphatidate cytidylyltransferase n=1 Tax=Devosia nanyangense TaxID=1228055 RepID=A0A933KX26_9HYPH|nr:phosphatidate cytidylyltransferase [Devosia nanyangense]